MSSELAINFNTFMCDFWRIKYETDHDFCLCCGSKDVDQYYTGVGQFHNQKFVRFRSDGIYKAIGCNKCGWDDK